MIIAIIMTSTMSMTIHTQVSGTCARLDAALVFKESIKSGVRIISGNESSTKQQTATNPGSKMRHKPESRKSSVFAVP